MAQEPVPGLPEPTIIAPTRQVSPSFVSPSLPRAIPRRQSDIARSLLSIGNTVSRLMEPRIRAQRERDKAHIQSRAQDPEFLKTVDETFKDFEGTDEAQLRAMGKYLQGTVGADPVTLIDFEAHAGRFIGRNAFSEIEADLFSGNSRIVADDLAGNTNRLEEMFTEALSADRARPILRSGLARDEYDNTAGAKREELRDQFDKLKAQGANAELEFFQTDELVRGKNGRLPGLLDLYTSTEAKLPEVLAGVAQQFDENFRVSGLAAIEGAIAGLKKTLDIIDDPEHDLVTIARFEQIVLENGLHLGGEKAPAELRAEVTLLRETASREAQRQIGRKAEVDRINLDKFTSEARAIGADAYAKNIDVTGSPEEAMKAVAAALEGLAEKAPYISDLNPLLVSEVIRTTPRDVQREELQAGSLSDTEGANYTRQTIEDLVAEGKTGEADLLIEQIPDATLRATFKANRQAGRSPERRSARSRRCWTDSMTLPPRSRART